MRFCRRRADVMPTNNVWGNGEATLGKTGLMEMLRVKTHQFLDIKRSLAIQRQQGFTYGCGGRTRTYDLRVMSPTSFQLLYSAIRGTPLVPVYCTTQVQICQPIIFRLFLSGRCHIIVAAPAGFYTCFYGTFYFI